MKKENVENKKKVLIAKLLIFALVCVMVGVSFLFTAKIEELINFKYIGEQSLGDIDQTGLVVHFIDVDQADAIAIRFPNNQTMLIDSGDDDEQSNAKLMGYLENKFFAGDDRKTFDYMIITHSDQDHVGGADEVLEKYQVNFVYFPDVSKDKTKTFRKFYDAMLAEPDSDHKPHAAGEELTVGGVTVEFFSPFYNDITSANNNNQSPIMIITYGGRKVMFTGDARQDLEKDVLKNYPDTNFDVDVLKVAHHGSSSSSCKQFLEAVNPEYAVISVGKDNSYHHPTKEALERLKNVGVKQNCLYRTDENGNVIMSFSSNGTITFHCDNSTYVYTYVKWIYVAPGIIVVAFAIIFIPSALMKKSKKSAKTSNKNQLNVSNNSKKSKTTANKKKSSSQTKKTNSNKTKKN